MLLTFYGINIVFVPLLLVVFCYEGAAYGMFRKDTQSQYLLFQIIFLVMIPIMSNSKLSFSNSPFVEFQVKGVMPIIPQ